MRMSSKINKRDIIKRYIASCSDRSKLFDSMLYASLMLMLGTSIVGLTYLFCISYFDLRVDLSVIQMIASASLLIAQIFGLVGLILWTISKEGK